MVVAELRTVNESAPRVRKKRAIYRIPSAFGSMGHARTIADLEADIVALRASAERAGTALACLFSSSDEFEAAVVKVRREQGAFRTQTRTRYPLRSVALVMLMALVFLLI